MSTLKDRKAAREGEAVMVVWREAYSVAAPSVTPMRPGMTIYEIVKSVPDLPPEFEQRGVVMINGHEIVRGSWHLIRPKPSTRAKPIAVTLHMAPRGGKGGGQSTGKMVIAIVALVALTVLTAGIASGGWAAIGAGSAAWFAAGSVSAKVLAGAVGLIGALAISALTRPPAAKPKAQDTTEQQEAASSDGNVIEANGGVPRVIGTRKAFPPLACEPIVEFVGQDEFVEALYVLNGPHKLEEIKTGEALIADDDSIQYQTREGWQSDSLITLIKRYGRTNAPQIELSAHKTQAVSGLNLEDQVFPDKSLPKWHRYATSKSPDEVVLQFMFPGGLYYPADPTVYPVCVPIRIRIRKSGDTAWINLPEVHFRGKSSRVLRGQVILHWDATTIPPISDVTMSTDTGVAHIFYRAPSQSVAPADPGAYQWEAHSSFYSGSGNAYMTNGAATGIQNVYVDNNERTEDGSDWKPSGTEPATAGKNTAHFFLDSGTFPKGVYEIECMRGYAYANPSFAPATYQYSGGVRNMFKYQFLLSDARIIDNQSLYVSAVALGRIISIWREHPLPLPGFATIAMRAKNRRLEQVSTKASGYVQDWTGSAWGNWTTTSNPAPHFRDILCGRLNLDPVPDALVDDTALVDWRQACIDEDYTCDMIVDSMRLEDVLSLVASCGYARPYWSEVWGVIRDYDRSAESPVQVFTPRNSRGFKYRKAFPRLPDGLLISYRDDTEESKTKQTTVYRNGVPASDTARLEQVTYEGLIVDTKVEKRGDFDLKQGEYRGTFYTLDAPVESIVCRRGDLVAVNHDLLTRKTGWGRVVQVIKSGGNITAVRVDSDLDFTSNGDWSTIADITAVEDILDVGVTMGCMIRRADGTITTHALSNATGTSDLLTFTTPFADDTMTGSDYDDGIISEVSDGVLVAVGPLGEEYLRLLITEIMPSADMTARITMVDEAPALWA